MENTLHLLILNLVSHDVFSFLESVFGNSVNVPVETSADRLDAVESSGCRVYPPIVWSGFH